MFSLSVCSHRTEDGEQYYPVKRVVKTKKIKVWFLLIRGKKTLNVIDKWRPKGTGLLRPIMFLDI